MHKYHILPFFIFLLTLAVCSCRSVRYVPIDTIKYDTTFINKIQRDSIYRLDSVYVRDIGDTVFVEKFRYVFVDKVAHDTFYVSRKDSVQVPYPVERELTAWERVKMDAGGVAIGIVIVTILIVVGCLIYWLKKGGVS